MKNVALLIVVLAFLAGAFITSLDPRLVDWIYFIPVILIGALGVYIYLRSLKIAAQSSDLLAADKKVLSSSIENIVTNLVKLDEGKTDIPTYEMRFEIDKLFREDLNNFADARESLKHLYGLQAFADVMSAFAAGERYLNRVWSASTDGYVDEVLLYVGKAKTQFLEAAEELRRVSSKKHKL